MKALNNIVKLGFIFLVGCSFKSDPPRSHEDKILIEGHNKTNNVLPKYEGIESSNRIVDNNINQKGVSVDTVNLQNYGVKGDGTDESVKIQNAFNEAVNKVLFIPKQKGSNYLSGQIIVPSNIHIVCDRGVLFKAKNNLKQDIKSFEVLFRFENSKNVVFNGNGAKFFMDKKYYNNEFNHLFMVNGATNVTLKNILAESSGGDGFYVGAYNTNNKYSENITVLNCKAKFNRRQGLSITSVLNFKAESSEFSYSKGNAPCSGVDIEPNNANAILKNIYFKDCLARGNERRGFLVTLSRLNDKSQSVDITFENCKAIDNYNGFTSMYFSSTSSGEVKFIKCIAENSLNSGFTELSSSGLGAKKIYDSCISKNNSKNSINVHDVNNSGFSIYNVRNRIQKYLGNSQFINCEIINEAQGIQCGFFVEPGGKVVNLDIINMQFKGGVQRKTNLLIKDSLKTTGGLTVARNDF